MILIRKHVDCEKYSYIDHTFRYCPTTTFSCAMHVSDSPLRVFFSYKVDWFHHAECKVLQLLEGYSADTAPPVY